MGISALSVAFSVFVLNIRHGAENKTGFVNKQRNIMIVCYRIPPWLNFLGFCVLGPLFGGRRQEINARSSRKEAMNSHEIRNQTMHDEMLSKSLVSHNYITSS